MKTAFGLTALALLVSSCPFSHAQGFDEDPYYNDDLLAGFLDQGSDILTKCNIDYNSILESSAEMMGQLSATGAEPVDYDQAVQEIKALARECSTSEAAQFNNALKAFHTCSSIDLEVVLESFADALVGTIMQCTLAIAPLADQVMEPDFSIPEICIESILGQNPVGDLARSYLLTPDKTLPCFSTLSKALPECTLEKWPIPLIGKIMKQVMCILGGSVELVDEMASAQMLFLSTCLQDGQSCEDSLAACTEGTLTLMLPKPLQGAPLSDAMIRAAKQEGISDVVDRYNTFVEKCIPDRWVGWTYEMGAYEGSTTYNKQSQESLMESPPPQKSGTSESSSGGGGGSPTGPFMGGLLTGLVLVGGFWAYTALKAKKRGEMYRGVEMVGNDLSLT